MDDKKREILKKDMKKMAKKHKINFVYGSLEYNIGMDEPDKESYLGGLVMADGKSEFTRVEAMALFEAACRLNQFMREQMRLVLRLNRCD
jgi:hypothetical protein